MAAIVRSAIRRALTEPRIWKPRKSRGVMVLEGERRSFLAVLFDNSQQLLRNRLAYDLVVKLVQAAPEPEVKRSLCLGLLRGLDRNRFVLPLTHRDVFHGCGT